MPFKIRKVETKKKHNCNTLDTFLCLCASRSSLRGLNAHSNKWRPKEAKCGNILTRLVKKICNANSAT